MVDVTYVGPFDSVDIETRPGVFTTVRYGESVQVLDTLAYGTEPKGDDPGRSGLLDQAVWAKTGHENEKVAEQAGEELAAAHDEDALEDADKATLIAAAEALGVEVSARWGEKRIREAIAEAEAD